MEGSRTELKEAQHGPPAQLIGFIHIIGIIRIIIMNIAIIISINCY